MYLIAQIFVVLLILAAIVYFFGVRRKKPVSFTTGLCVLTVIAALFSSQITELIPRPTDNIVISATGEKNEAAKSNEVSIKCLMLEGESLILDNAVEGKWFWKGDCYMWRPETDPRQPDGTTRSITLELPVGLERSLVFDNNKYRGIIEITLDGETTSYDLYSETNSDMYIDIPTVNVMFVYGYKIFSILIFLLIICILMAFPCYAVLKKSENVLRAWLAKHWDKLIYISLAILYVLLLRKNSYDGSFWCDEVWALGWLYGGNPNYSYLVFDLISLFWLNIMPYGQENLLLLSQLFVAGTIYLAGIIGATSNNKCFGVIFSSLVAFSLSIAYQCAMEIRNYAALLFFVTVSLYLFVCKQKTGGNDSYIRVFLYGLSIAVVMDTHTFGIAVVGLIMLADFVQLVLGKLKKRYWYEFIIPAIYGVYYLYFQFFKYDTNFISNYSWAPKLTPQKFLNTVRWLCSSDNLLMVILFIGCVIIVIKTVETIRKRTFSFYSDFINMTMVYIPSMVFAVVYFYSSVLNPNNSLFIDRYFISVIPCILYIIAYVLDRFIKVLCSIIKEKYMQQYTVIVIMSILMILNWTQITPWEIYPASDRTNIHDYRTSVEFLMKQNDIYNDKTYTFIDHNEYANIGMTYYITHKGKKDDINRSSIYQMPENISEYDIIYITNSYYRGKHNSILQNLLSEEYTLDYYDDNNKVYRYYKK